MNRFVCLALSTFALSSQMSGQVSNTLIRLATEHGFSSHTNVDTFSLEVRGANLFESFVQFRIVSWQGDEIYKHRFSMDQLMERGPRDRRSPEDSLVIIDALNHFLDEVHFSNPAMMDSLESNSGNLLPRDKWIEIWEDKTAIGFSYQLGAEDGRGIAYSKKSKRVVLFYKCC
jgi:hypothetical protein